MRETPIRSLSPRRDRRSDPRSEHEVSAAQAPVAGIDAGSSITADDRRHPEWPHSHEYGITMRHLKQYCVFQGRRHFFERGQILCIFGNPIYSIIKVISQRFETQLFPHSLQVRQEDIHIFRRERHGPLGPRAQTQKPSRRDAQQSSATGWPAAPKAAAPIDPPTRDAPWARPFVPAPPPASEAPAASSSVPWRSDPSAATRRRLVPDGHQKMKIVPTATPAPSTRSRTPTSDRQPQRLNLNEMLPAASASDPPDFSGKVVLHFYVG